MQRGELVHRIKELHNEYGDIVRTAPNELSFISGNAFHQLYGHRAGHGTTPKSPLRYDPVPKGLRSIFGVNETDRSRLRRLLSHSFSDKALRDQEPILQSHVNILVDTFSKRATKSKSRAATIILTDEYIRHNKRTSTPGLPCCFLISRRFPSSQCFTTSISQAWRKFCNRSYLKASQCAAWITSI